MPSTSQTNMIFDINKAMLTEYYTDVPAATIDFLSQCHRKIIKETHSLLHLTTNLEGIKKSSNILMSAGGLAGCMYTVPVFSNGVAHNLGNYLLSDELPMFLRNQNRDGVLIDGVLIEIPKPKFGCIDYLAFGKQYSDHYEGSSYLKQKISAAEIDAVLQEQRQVLHRLFTDCQNESLQSQQISAAIAHACEKSYLVRMLYFEIAIEFVFLHQDDDTVSQYTQQKEVYNRYAKDMVFKLNPELATRFSLSNFKSTPQQIVDYLQTKSSQNKVIRNFNQHLFYGYIKKRFAMFIERYFLNDESNLKGHLLFRNFDERHTFEILLAEQLWDEANRLGFNVLSYRMPKGELGIMPNAAFKTNVGKRLGESWEKGDLLNLSLSRELATKHTVMRNPYGKK